MPPTGFEPWLATDMSPLQSVVLDHWTTVCWISTLDTILGDSRVFVSPQPVLGQPTRVPEYRTSGDRK